MARHIVFLKNLASDGYKAVGYFAPTASALFWLFKILGQPMIMINPAELSWAWGFAPLTIWFFTAYFRRWQKYQTIEEERDELRGAKDYEKALDDLSKLFDEGNQKILNHYEVTNEVQYRAWKETWGKWGKRVQLHLKKHFGLSESNLFRNIVYYDTLEDLNGINDRHKDERSMLVHQLETIRQIIVRHSDKVQKWRSAIISASEITN